jgi:activator of HSP90 ATPase
MSVIGWILTTIGMVYLINMKTIRQTYAIDASLAEVWQAFFDPKVIDRWGGGPADISEKENSGFSLWGGEIHGSNRKIIKHKTLVQDWFDSDKWDAPSKVTVTFNAKGDQTVVSLLHENIPDASLEDIDEGWKKFYFGPMKDALEA